MFKLLLHFARNKVAQYLIFNEKVSFSDVMDRRSSVLEDKGKEEVKRFQEVCNYVSRSPQLQKLIEFILEGQAKKYALRTSSEQDRHFVRGAMSGILALKEEIDDIGSDWEKDEDEEFDKFSIT